MKEEGGVRIFNPDDVARARHGKGAGARSFWEPKTCFSGLARSEERGRATLPVVDPRAPSAGARTHQGHHADARGMQARQEGGLNTPCNLVASAECCQAHRAGTPRPSHGRARCAGAR
ncbi:hypothetical protein PIB30_017442 [Stylosanthes scabra]|uniref:HNH endonuclease n=1 Tax=Stylosanthes scabra TaxID=79078 RepID=A0ABU6X545_9FABA|nr:hypothetical protein [Stylosanthes scabra]